MRAILITLLTLGLLGIAPAAGAASTTGRDGEDGEGRLDLSRVSLKKVLRWRGQSVAWTRTAGCRTAPTCTDVLGAGGSGFHSWKA